MRRPGSGVKEALEQVTARLESAEQGARRPLLEAPEHNFTHFVESWQRPSGRKA